MKKILFALLLFTTAYANEFTGTLTAKILPNENQGYWIFSDGTFWKVTAFVKRWRSPLEWISGTELFVPENYICSLADWAFGDEFDVYLKYGNLRVDETAASNESDLKNYTHLLVNPRTEKILFAIPLHPADFAIQLYNEGYEIGYNSGYSNGYSAGYSSGQTAAANRD